MALNINGHGATDGARPSTDAATRKFAVQLGLEEDDPMLPLLQANAQLEAKVEQWSTAILELAALARNQNQAMQETSRNSLRLTSALSSFEQESAQLRQLIAQLGNALATLKRTNGKDSEGLNQNALQTLVPLLHSIHQDLGTIDQKLPVRRLHSTKNPSPSRFGNVNQWLCWVAAFQFLLSILVIGTTLVQFHRVAQMQDSLLGYANWSFTKLERVEKALGIEPKR